MNFTISYIIPSMNRESLRRTISSIEMRPGDQICVEYDIPPSKRWGNDQRNKAMERADGTHLAFIDDDDEYLPGYREIFARALKDKPDYPHLFKMRYPNGDVLWKTKEVIPGNIGSPMILVPNNINLHYWEDGRNMADFIFVDKWRWPEEQIIWHDEIVAQLGHSGHYEEQRRG